MLTTGERKPEKYFPKFEPLAETVQRVVENITTRTGKPEYETGLQVIDKGIFGLHQGQLTTISARPGQGKTSFICQVGLNLAKQKKTTAFISLEMTKETILERMFCIEYNVPGFDLIMGKIQGVEKSLSHFAGTVSKLPLCIVDDYCHTENELYTLVEHLKFRPEVLILDHIQHIRSVGKMNQWESLTQYLRFLKEIAHKHKIAVVVLSQINRQGEEAPTLANLKGTGAIEEMSDHVLLLNQLKEKTEKGNNFKIQIAKNRFGPTGTFELYFTAEHFKFYNSEYEARIR